MPDKKVLFINFIVMVKSVLQKPLSSVKLSRNAFDVGYTNKFTSSLGMLLPCYVRECNPDEHYRINPRMFCRSMPMNSAAFIQCSQNIEFYFVPYRLLWHSFPQWISGTKFDVSSSMLSEEKSTFPTFDLGFLFQTLKSRTSLTDVLGYNLYSGALRLLDLLGYGDLSHLGNTINLVNIQSLSVSPFRLLAYQKICNDFYRVSSYQSSDVVDYNVDTMISQTGSSAQSFIRHYCRLNYRPWKKDLYTISNPTFQGSDFMSVETRPTRFPEVHATTNFVPDTWRNSDNYQSGLIGSVASGTNTAFSVSNIRSAFALDKLYRLSSQASDGDYKSQIKARYGFDAYAPDYKAQFIGSSSAQVQINPITTTADTLSTSGTNGTPAGRIYGNGLAANDSDVFEFDVKEHGIIMGISSFVPDVDYSSYGVHPMNQKINREDYFIPEFDNLGRQPLSSLSLFPWVVKSAGNEGQFALTLSNNVLGWFPRYAEYKTSLDEVHGQLNGYLPRSSMLSPTLGVWTAPRFNASDNSKFDNWRINGFSKDFFYIDPCLYNSVFVNQYDGFQDSDQFICEVSNNVQAILPMSVSGEPLI